MSDPKPVRRIPALAIAALLAGAATAPAQEESTNRVAAQTDWSVFAEPAGDPTECWGVSAPKETVNTRDGRVVAVRRGDILLFVSFRRDDDVEAEVSFTGGYPFANGSTVELTIGSDAFELFTDGEWAWPADPEADAAVVAAMKRGAEAVVVGRSSRGTRTQDTFSLMGFTAALSDAESQCGG